MKIAVTTASGNLGAAIINHLKQEVGAENIIGVARRPEKAKSLGVEIRKGDYNNREDFNMSLKDIDAVLLVSGMDHPDKRVQQHRNVIEAAKDNGVQKIVYTSIVGADEGNAFSPIYKRLCYFERFNLPYHATEFELRDGKKVKFTEEQRRKLSEYMMAHLKLTVKYGST